VSLERVPSADGTLVLERIGLVRAQALLAGDLDVLAPWQAAPGWPTPFTNGGLRITLEGAVDDSDTGFLVVETATGRVVGDCGWHGRPGLEGDVEIGYGLAASVHGRGLGGVMVQTLTDWSVEQPGVRRVVAETGSDNLPSRRALERAGFDLDHVDGDRVWYALDGPQR
jgi:RimJ/RimL family protein N-acetyltransferase